MTGGRAASVDGDDLVVVAGQLARTPHEISRVAARCPFGYPAAVETLPYDRHGAPFPTLYYLTCPTCVREVSRLEGSGGVGEWSARVRSSAELARSVAEAGAATSARRRELASRCSCAPLDAGASLSAGVAGTVHPSAVKCLHAHVAHALTHPGYLFGEAVVRALGEPWCADERCAAFLPEDQSP